MKCFWKIIIFFGLGLGILATMSACGRYSPAEPVEDSGFPHNYPRK